ncbi:glycosyltransferase family 61 protein [Cereibacter sp. SYSU M97828]|nr:glycosyltransferase family 61 protein [Cereibacter flavus]
MIDPPRLTRASAEDFFIPGIDRGMAVIKGQSGAPAFAHPLDFGAVALASDVEQQLELCDAVADIRRTIWKNGVIFPTVLAVASDVGFHDKYVTVTGKYLISAGAGRRLLARYRRLGRKQAIQAAIVSRRFKTASLDCEIYQPESNEDWRFLPFVIEARNFFNYYHFLTEALPLLTLVHSNNLIGPIIFVTASGTGIRRFAYDLIETWFPELRNRIHFSRGTLNEEKAIVALSSRDFYEPPDSLSPSDGDRCSNSLAARQDSTLVSQIVGRNSTDKPLQALRQIVLPRVLHSHARSRRLYVKRRSRRTRRVIGEHLLEPLLESMGFETIYFEDMSVRDQATAVAQAECIVALHGAGLANMLFAPRNCLILELSNFQTLIGRFGDFNALALSAGVRYFHVFLDHDHSDKTVLPRIISDGHRGVEIAEFDAKVIASIIHSALDEDSYRSALNLCRSLNEEKWTMKHREQLQSFSHILYHNPDWHVWRANVFSQIGDKSTTLHHLRRAMKLAPERLPLLRRVAVVSKEINDEQSFLEAIACFMHRDAKKCTLFLKSMGHPLL